jgi:hypothetical protein
MTDLSAIYPLHYLTWNNQYDLISEYLADLKTQSTDNETYLNHLEKRDNKGRSPLHLAIALGHLESMQALLSAGADINIENAQKWSALQEAISTGDPEIVGKALQYRLYQRTVGELSQHSKAYTDFVESADFYVEIKWEVTSWIPLVSSLFAPNDVLKVWKIGDELRLDNSLVGFESLRWVKGHRSTLIKFVDESSMKVTIIDHDKSEATITHTESVVSDPRRLGVNSRLFKFSDNHVAKRLTEPTCDSLMDFDGCSIVQKTVKPGLIFNRNISEGAKIDDICGYNATHYHVDGVKVVTRKRTEHLENGDENNTKESIIESFISKIKSGNTDNPTTSNSSQNFNSENNPENLSAEEYFSLDKSSIKDIGRPVKMSSKSHNVQLNMWIVDQDEYPLDLKSQIRPLIEIAAISNPHFSRLKLFFDDLLPPGVPIKTEIPLFNLITARCTVEKALKLTDADKHNSDLVPENCFEIPDGFETIEHGQPSSRNRSRNSRPNRNRARNHDDGNLDLEMQYQSQLQQAIQQSLNVDNRDDNAVPTSESNENQDDELARILRQSVFEQ